MQRIHRRPELLLLALALMSLALLIALPILAQTGGGYDLAWSSIDGGGGTSSSGGYTLSGVIGQPDAGLASGGSYTLAGGFWLGLAGSNPSLFLPFIRRQADLRLRACFLISEDVARGGDLRRQGSIPSMLA
jgi:hypothetical protein